jgi:hypothetical protein
MGAVVWLLPLWAAAQSAVLQIHVVEGEGVTHALGARAARFLVVKVTDDLGKPLAGVLVSFRLPEEGPGGLFANGLPTEVVTTGQDGIASAPPVRWNRLPGAFEMRVVAATAESRAGTVVPLYLSAEGRSVEGITAGRAATTVPVAGRPRNRWLLVGLAAASAVGVGFSTGWAKKSPPEAPKAPEPLRIGPPVISVGRP